MSATAIQTDSMVTFVLLNTPEQVNMARCLVRAALDHGGLERYADDAEIITSELVTNAMQHASSDPAEKIGVTLMRVWGQEALAVVVTDSSPTPPVRLNTTADSTHGRGLQVVEALSAHWGWHPEADGKAVYAVIADGEVTGHNGTGGMAIVAVNSGPPRRRLDMIPRRQAAIVGANIRTLRQHKGWTQAELGELMGWQSASTVCAAEGHRDGRQRGFTTEEVERLATIFGISPSRLRTRFANCGGQPPAGFAGVACGTTPSDNRPASTAATDGRTHPVRHGHTEPHQ